MTALSARIAVTILGLALAIAGSRLELANARRG